MKFIIIRHRARAEMSSVTVKSFDVPNLLIILFAVQCEFADFAIVGILFIFNFLYKIPCARDTTLSVSVFS